MEPIDSRNLGRAMRKSEHEQSCERRAYDEADVGQHVEPIGNHKNGVAVGKVVVGRVLLDGTLQHDNARAKQKRDQQRGRTHSRYARRITRHSHYTQRSARPRGQQRNEALQAAKATGCTSKRTGSWSSVRDRLAAHTWQPTLLNGHGVQTSSRAPRSGDIVSTSNTHIMSESFTIFQQLCLWDGNEVVKRGALKLLSLGFAGSSPARPSIFFFISRPYNAHYQARWRATSLRRRPITSHSAVRFIPL